MKRYLTLIVIAVTMWTGAAAQLLWRVQSPTNPKPSYLLGTKHDVPGTFLDSIEGFDTALATVDVIVGEVNPDDLQSDSTEAKMAAAMIAPADSTLSRVLAPDIFTRLDSILKDLSGGMTRAKAFERFKPVAVSAFIEVLIPTRDTNNVTDKHIEQAIEERAVARGAQILSLETADEQITSIFNNPISDQARELTETVTQWDESLDEVETFNSDYLSQNISGIERAFADDKSISVEDRSRLVTDRNNRWMPRIKAIIDTMPALIYVGVGHLVGDQGLITLLRRDGYEVMPIGAQN
jgi:hypothetical protein